jgi:superfamily I DNA and/or RNA helicase
MDEANRVSEAESASLLARYGSKGREGLIMLGDRHQIPPYVTKNGKQEAEYFKGLNAVSNSLFTRFGEAGFDLVELNIQQRAHVKIADLSARLAYGSLETPVHIEQRLSVISSKAVLSRITLKAPVHVQWLEFSDSEEKQDKASKFNIRNVEGVICLLFDIMINEKSRVKPEDILIVVPYNAQRKKYRETLKECKRVWLDLPLIKASRMFQNIINRLFDIEIISIDGAAGLERSWVIFDTTITERPSEFLQDYRRLNVAVSRAQDVLLVVGKHSCPDHNKVADRAKIPSPFPICTIYEYCREIGGHHDFPGNYNVHNLPACLDFPK